MIQAFWTISVHFWDISGFDRQAFALRFAVFYSEKGGLSLCERLPFSIRKAIFCNLKGIPFTNL